MRLNRVLCGASALLVLFPRRYVLVAAIVRLDSHQAEGGGGGVAPAAFFSEGPQPTARAMGGGRNRPKILRAMLAKNVWRPAAVPDG